MRLARIDACRLDSSAPLAAVAAAGQLDLLQLDYGDADPRTHSAKFLEHFRTLHKHLFLEPDLRLVTNAGAGAVVACVEALGEYLREHADERMPISAVRGDNLLPRLEELAAEGLELVDDSTGRPLRDRQEPLVAAQVELGAGPFATAWDEGSRIVVAGCYDAVAPFIGAATSECRLAWTDYDALARLALAAKATAIGSAIAEFDDPGALTLETCAAELLDVDSLVKRLREAAEDQSTLRCADVKCDLDGLQLHRTETGKLSVDGVLGRKPAETWRVRLTYAAGGVVDSPRRTPVRWSRIPRDAVRISVDTRPARDWY